MNSNKFETHPKPKLESGWGGFIHVAMIYGLFEPLYRYNVDDFQRLLSALTRGRNPKILYIEYDYSDEGEHFVQVVDQEFKAFLEKKGVVLLTDEVDYVGKDGLKEFLKQKGAMSLFVVEIEDGEDTATVVAYV
jgi:hypothetical protein